MTDRRRFEWERHAMLTEAFGPNAERKLLEAAFTVMRAFERLGEQEKVFVPLRAERAFIDKVWEILPPEVRGKVWIERTDPISLWRDQPDVSSTPPSETYQPPSVFGSTPYPDEKGDDDG